MSSRLNESRSLLAAILIVALGAFTLLTVFSLGIQTQAAQQHTTDLEAATYLGSSGNDYAGGVEFDQDGNVLVAVNSTANFGQTPVALDGGGNGAIIKLNRGGTQVLSVTRVAEWIDDLAVDYSSGRVAVATNDGIKLFSGDLTNHIFTNQLNTTGSGNGGSIEVVTNGRRVAFGQNGQVAFLSNKQYAVYEPNGNQLVSSSIGNTRVNAIALDSTNQTIFLGGDTQLDTGSCSTYRSPYIRAFGYNQVEKFDVYNPTNNEASAANSSCADSQIIDLHIGRDGRLYAIGYSDGGNTIFRQNPYNLNTPCNCQVNITETPSVNPGNQYTSLSNSGAGNYSWILKFNLQPSTLDIVNTQVHVARLGEGGNANSLSLRDIKVDTDGTVAVIGDSAFLYAHRDLQRTSIKGTSVQNQANGTYAGDAITMILSPNLQTRLTGTSNQSSGSQGGRSIAIQNGHWVNLGILSTGSQIYTGNAIQAGNAGGRELFMNAKALPNQQNSSSEVSQQSSQQSSMNSSSQLSSIQSSLESSQSSFDSSNSSNSSITSSEVQSSQDTQSSETSQIQSSQSVFSQQSISSQQTLSSAQLSEESSVDSSVSQLSSAQSQPLQISSSQSVSQNNFSSQVSQAISSSIESVSQSISTVSSDLAINSNVLRLQTPENVNQGQRVTLALDELRLTNGQIAANYNLTIVITTPSGNVYRLQTTTDSNGNLTSCNIGGTGGSVGIWDLISPVSAFACPTINQSTFTALQTPGAYSAFVELVDGGNLLRTNLISWRVMPITSTPRTGGWSLATAAMLFVTLGLLVYIYYALRVGEQK